MSINPIGAIVYLLLTGIVILAVLRITGHYQPAQQVSNPSSSALIFDSSRAYLLLGVHQGKLYFFDRQAESIFEYDPAHPDTQERIGSLSIPSVEAILPSHQSDRIALVSASVRNQTGIYILNLPSPNLRLITGQQSGFTPGYALALAPTISWSPDGQSIAFVAYKDDQSDLFVAYTNGTRVQRLTYHGASVGSVAWIDQETIAFVSDWEGHDMMYLIEPDGGNLRRAR